VTYWTYRPSGALETMLTVDAQGLPVQTWTYSYDPAGNPIAKTGTSSGTVERYGYDSRARLVRADYPAVDPGEPGELARFDGFRYDPVGNRLERWQEHGATPGAVRHLLTATDAANRLATVTSDGSDDDPSESTTTFRWMAQGALLEKTVALAGGDETSTYTFDAADRLLSYTVPEGSLTAEYDASGRRVKVEETVGGSTETDRVVFDGLQEVSFSDDAGAWKRSQATTRRLDEVLASSEDAGGGATTLRTHHGDLIQSGTLAVESAAGGGGGSTPRTARWRVFGELLEGDPGAVGFVGRPAEVGGMVPLRARAHNAPTGRLLSPDPWAGDETRPQTGHGFALVWSSPVAHTDPTGSVPVVAVFAVTSITFLTVGMELFAAGVKQMRGLRLEHGVDIRENRKRCQQGLALVGYGAVFLLMGTMSFGVVAPLTGGTYVWGGRVLSYTLGFFIEANLIKSLFVHILKRRLGIHWLADTRLVGECYSYLKSIGYYETEWFPDLR
jgi:YD repeat-containing protein